MSYLVDEGYHLVVQKVVHVRPFRNKQILNQVVVEAGPRLKDLLNALVSQKFQIMVGIGLFKRQLVSKRHAECQYSSNLHY